QHGHGPSSPVSYPSTFSSGQPRTLADLLLPDTQANVSSSNNAFEQPPPCLQYQPIETTYLPLVTKIEGDDDVEEISRQPESPDSLRKPWGGRCLPIPINQA